MTRLVSSGDHEGGRAEDVDRQCHRAHRGQREHGFHGLRPDLGEDSHDVADADTEFGQRVCGGRRPGREHVETSRARFHTVAESGDGGVPVPFGTVLEDPGDEQGRVQHRSEHGAPPAGRAVVCRRLPLSRSPAARGHATRRGTCTTVLAGSMLAVSYGRPVSSASRVPRTVSHLPGGRRRCGSR